MKTSDSIKEIATALSKAQASIHGAKKDTANPFFKSKYADLASVWDACREALTANGLSIVQMTDQSEKDEVIVETRILHSSGEFIEGRLALPVTKADAQGFGSALTYARRYALAAAVGVAPEEDDGNLAAAARPDTAARIVAAKVSPMQEHIDAFAALPKETQDVINEHAATLIHLHKTGGDMVGYIHQQEYDDETKLALWTRLPSNVRSAIKHAQQIASLQAGIKPALASQG